MSRVDVGAYGVDTECEQTARSDSPLSLPDALVRLGAVAVLEHLDADDDRVGRVAWQ